MEYLHRRQALGRDKQRELAPQPRDTEQGVPWLSPFGFRWIAVYGALLLSPFLEGCTVDTPTTPAAPDAAVQSAMGMSADSARIIIEPHWLTLEGTGATGTLTARVTNADGNAVASPQVTWASADAAVATVSGAGNGVGRVTAAGLGKTRVTATYNSVTAEATVEVALPLTDREILEILYEATGGDGWTDNTNWLSNKDLSEWYGVGMSGDKVDDLRLYDNNLVGTIPPELGGLDELFILSLGDNKLSGPIPPELSKLKRLRDLLLYGNAEISGRLPPELGYTGGLEYLSTDGTNLNGPVPLTFANLELTHFYFDRDDLCIPAGLEAWLKTVLETEDDYSICSDQITVDPRVLYFEGPPLGDTARLTAEVITAEGNTIHDAKITWSSADTTIATVDSAGLVTAVDYGTTQVTATSDALTATAEVQVVLTLTDRQVLDSIHQLMGGENWTDTTNWLSDEPLSEWYGVETNAVGKVAGLSLANNGLAGPMPDLLAELGNLVTLDLSRNALTGEIPGGLAELAQLRTLVLNDNALEGRLPASMGSLAALRYLHIGTNELSGVVPRSFRQLALDTLYTASSGVCVPPSLNEWFAGIGQTDDADHCVASLAIKVVDLPSLTFYAVGESGTLSATHVDAEGDSTHEASVTWSSGDATVASVDVRGKVTAVGEGATEVTATYNAVTASIAVEVALPENDRDVLGIFYDRTRGTAWTDGANWLSDEPLSEWAGVETDESGRVIGLSLTGNNLRGTLHPSIGQLDQLVTLDLRRNWITGSIPAEIGILSRLRDLALSVNGFSGRLPSGLGALASLRELNMVATSLSGPVPASFAALELDSFLVGGTELCVPPSLATWLGAIPQKDSPPECAALVSVEPSTLTFGAAGQTAQLSVTVVDAEGNVVESPEVTWETADRLVATVDPTGLVTARAAGITAVAATYESVTAGSAEVAVSLPGSDRAALEALYHATRGDDWKDNTNWLSDEPLEEWYGVQTRGGRVDYLDLGKNNLDGQIPAAIGLLDTLFILDLSGNAIAGAIPPAIGRLQGLRDLTFRDTELEGPVPPEMGNMKGLEYLSFTNTNLSGPLPETFANLNVERFYHSGTGLCVPRSLAAWYETLGNTDPLPCIPETADREVLVALHDATDGPGWRDRHNWMTDKGVNTWRGIATDEEGYVTEIFLPWNRLTGSIPPQLGNLARLEVLALYGNDLKGRIPPELGQLSSLEWLYLNGNNLTGTIPSELGSLAALERFSVSRNNLTGPIPPELVNLSSLEYLWLYSNGLSGPILPEFGGLSGLQLLRVEANNLEGPVPPEIGQLTALRFLAFSNNAELSGILPASLTALVELEELQAGGTDLCAPSDSDFVHWLAGIDKLRVARCDAGTGSTAYLTQAVQSREFPVPLLAGKEALLRVFATAAQANSERMPPVRATFFLDGAPVHTAEVPGKPGPIPTTVVEGDLRMSSNATVPAEVLQPGLEMVIEVDPGGTLDPALEVASRIPETGRLAVDVRAMPVLDLTLIPLIWEEQPERRVVDLIGEMAADPTGHELLSETRSLLPVTGLAIKAHAPVTTSTNNTSRLLGELRAIRTMEGGSGHYMGIMARFEEWAGRAARPGRVSVSVPNPSTIAHELGHNMNLQHAPCGEPETTDPSFPYSRGQIGALGYDLRLGRLVAPNRPDLMSYCNPRWISDYHLTNAIGFRLRDEADTTTATAAPARSLLVWGGVDAWGMPHLEPAFVLDAPPALPDSDGEYRLTGLTPDGREIFSLGFAMPEVADGDGGSSFVFALPVRPGWAGNLAAISLSGPGGTVTMDRDTDRPMVIRRDPRTGQVRSILRGARPETLAQPDVAGDLAPGSHLRALSSRGIPDADAWRR